MEQQSREYERLARRFTRLLGLGAAAVGVLGLLLPDALQPGLLAGIAAPLALVVAALVLTGRSRSPVWPLLAPAAVIVLLVVALIIGPEHQGAVFSLGTLAGGTAASTSFVLLRGRVGRITVVVAGAVTSALMIALAAPFGLVGPSVSTASTWLTLALVTLWLQRSEQREAARVERIAAAFREQQRASEREAQRRQNARLMHDTVLATLTLLAHSGVGVGSDDLRRRAAEDAQMLRQLRLGLAPAPGVGDIASDPGAPLPPVLGETLQAVSHRFDRIGLRVSWHGLGHVVLAPHVLDAFVRSIAECLENVRRHAGVDEADVTVSETDDTVRAVVTDAGVGFDVNSVDGGRLGIAESVVARLADVGGSARLFSAIGHGTTVVVEVPRA